MSQNDALAAQGLLDQVAKRESEIAVQTLEQELSQLLALALQDEDANSCGHSDGYAARSYGLYSCQPSAILGYPGDQQ